MRSKASRRDSLLSEPIVGGNKVNSTLTLRTDNIALVVIYFGGGYHTGIGISLAPSVPGTFDWVHFKATIAPSYQADGHVSKKPDLMHVNIFRKTSVTFITRPTRLTRRVLVHVSTCPCLYQNHRTLIVAQVLECSQYLIIYGTYQACDSWLPCTAGTGTYIHAFTGICIWAHTVITTAFPIQAFPVIVILSKYIYYNAI